MALNGIFKLADIARKDSRLILGLMSGTSLDGLDIALCKITGNGLNTKANILHFITVPYHQDFKDEVRQIFSKQIIDLQKLTVLNAFIGTLHAELVLDTLRLWKIDPNTIDCIASHGQTVFHAPKRLHGLAEYGNATLQIGDADHIAVKTGIITMSDFRQKHIAAGGEGAPLALYGDYLLFSSSGESRILLNIGGISNFTFLPAGDDFSKAISTDAGPGNTLIDAVCKRDFNVSFDENGNLARQGNVCESLLNALLEHPFFKEDFPKSTGPELFNLDYLLSAQKSSGTNNLPSVDLVATVTQFTVNAIALSICKLNIVKAVAFVSGGGLHNQFLTNGLKNALPDVEWKSFSNFNMDPDAKEALLFAVLANEMLAGDITYGATMGKISLPD